MSNIKVNLRHCTVLLLNLILLSSQASAAIKPAFDTDKYNKLIASSTDQVETKAVGIDDSMGIYDTKNDYISPVDVSAPTALKPLPTEEEVAATVNCGCAHAWYNKWGNDLETSCLDVEKQSARYNKLVPTYSNPWKVYWGFTSSNSTEYKVAFNSNSQVIKIYSVNSGSEVDITSKIKDGINLEKFAIKGSGDIESGISCKIAYINPIRTYVYKTSTVYTGTECHWRHHGDQKICTEEKSTYSSNNELTYGPGYFYPPENDCSTIFKNALAIRRVSGSSNDITRGNCKYVSRSAY